MKVILKFQFFTILATCLAVSLEVAASDSGPVFLGQDRPNVVIVYGDDVGYGDVGAYGATKIPTPNISMSTTLPSFQSLLVMPRCVG